MRGWYARPMVSWAGMAMVFVSREYDVNSAVAELRHFRVKFQKTSHEWADPFPKNGISLSQPCCTRRQHPTLHPATHPFVRGNPRSPARYSPSGTPRRTARPGVAGSRAVRVLLSAHYTKMRYHDFLQRCVAHFQSDSKIRARCSAAKVSGY